MAFLDKLLRHHHIIFFGSLLLGLLFPRPAQSMESWLIVLVGFVITLSLMSVSFYHLSAKNLRRSLILLGLSFLVLPLNYYVVSHLFVSDPDFLNGILIYTLTPPAAGLIALSYLLGGNVKESAVAELLGYLLAIVTMPLSIWWLFREHVSVMYVFEIMIMVIVVPVILSQVLHYLERSLPQFNIPVKQHLTTLSFGLIFYIIIGLNRAEIFSHFSDMLPLFLTFAICQIGIGSVVFFLLKRFNVSQPEDVLYVLFVTQKNSSVAIAVVLLIFNARATLPMVADTVIYVLFILFMEGYTHRAVTSPLRGEEQGGG